MVPKLPPPCFAFLGGELLEVGNGKAVVRFTPTEEMENPYGQVQGGILAGMMDNIIGPATVSAMPDRRSATIQMSVNYLRSVRSSETIIGTAEVIKQGRTQVYLEAKLNRESDGKLLATASATNVFLDAVEYQELKTNDET